MNVPLVVACLALLAFVDLVAITIFAALYIEGKLWERKVRK